MFWFFLSGKKRAGLLYGAIVMILASVVFLGVGISYLIGDRNVVDLNDPDCDYFDIGRNTHVVGNVERSWGVAVVESGDNGKYDYYAVPQFDSDKHPSEFVSVLVIKPGDLNDAKTLDSITDDTVDWFRGNGKAPTESVHVDGYAQKMSDDMYDAAIDFLMSCDFSREESEDMLVPYYLVNNSSAKIFMFVFGGIMGVGGAILLVVWIKKRKDIVEEGKPAKWNSIED